MAEQKHGKGRGFLRSTAEDAMIEARRDAARMLHGMRGIVKLDDLHKMKARLDANRKNNRIYYHAYDDAARRLEKLFHNPPEPRTAEYEDKLTRLFEERDEASKNIKAINEEWHRMIDLYQRMLKQYNEQESLNPPEDNDLMD